MSQSYNDSDATSSGQARLLALPSAEDVERADAEKLDVSHQTSISMDHLGPIVINSDGTLSRISNWSNMTEIERERTLKIIKKRNASRQKKLEADEGAQ